jgi:hypothetical protein
MTGDVRPELTAPAAEPLVLEHAEVLQAAFEHAGVRGRELLPPGLAPTIPTLVTVLVVRVPGGGLGPFTLVQIRLSCRSGARARAFVAAQRVDTTAATAGLLAAGWGLGGERAPVLLHRGYDAVRATSAGLEVTLLDPSPISASDIQYVTNLQPATTGAGERLVQMEVEMDAYRAERGRAVLHTFDGPCWGAPGLHPVYPVSATIAVGTLTLPAVRFLVHPDRPAHEATERVTR